MQVVAESLNTVAKFNPEFFREGLNDVVNCIRNIVSSNKLEWGDNLAISKWSVSNFHSGNRRALAEVR